MSQQIQISGGAKVRNLQDVIIGTSGVLSSLAFDVANGVPKLDSNGKILVSQLPNSVMEYKGTWNAATNTPTLVNGTGNQGDVYLCNVAGTVNFGAGPIAFVVGDQVIYSGSIWQRASGATGTVTSVALTESGDSLNITGSPITTSGTINIGFNGTNLQYINGAGNLTTFPILTGYVPYTGATQDVDLGAFSLNGKSLHIKGTAGNGHLGLKHQSAAATGSANESLIYADSLGDLSWQNANLYLSKFITSANSANRSYTFPNATCNIPDDSLVVHLAGTETITGAKTFSGYTTFTSTVDITSGLTFSNSGFTLVLQPPTLSVNRTVTLPNGTGTLALTSDISYPVTSVFGRTGAVVATSGDYTTAQVTESGNLYYTDTRSRLALSGSTGISYNNTTGVITNSAPDQVVALTASTGISVTGTYPNFTITNTSPSSGGTVTSVAALTIGTSGTDLSSTVANSTTTPVITLNVPTASATNRGALSSADWTTFNNKASTADLANYLPLAGGTLTGQLYINPTNTATVGLDVASNTTRFRSDNLEGSKRQLELTMSSGTVVQMVAKGFGANYGTDLAFYTATTGGTNASPAIYITGTNNRVGIKTGTPSYDLDVSGTGRFTSTLLVSGAASFDSSITLTGNGTQANNTITKLSNGYMYVDGNTNGLILENNSTSSTRIRLEAADNMQFQTASTERMRISATGQVAINDTPNAAFQLYVKGSDSTSANIAFIVRNSTPLNLFYIRNDGFILTGTQSASPYNYSTTGRSAILDSSGVLGYLVSTRESKANIKSIENVDFINQLNPVSFNYRKKDIDTNTFTDELYDNTTYGFIADEVEKVNKELAFYNEDGSLAGVEYNSIIAILTKAVQEQQMQIQNLQEQINILAK